MPSAALIFWIGFCLYQHPPRIEAALRSESRRSLARAGLDQVGTDVNGRDAVLVGAVASPELRSEAARVVAGIEGVLSVRNELVLAPPLEAESPPPYLEIRSRPDGVTLRGPVPSEVRRRELVELARRLYPPEQVDDRLVVDPAAEDSAGQASAPAVLGVLARASQHVEARLEGDSLRLAGRVSSSGIRRRVEDEAQAAAPGVRLFFSSIRVDAASQGPTEDNGDD